MKEFVKRIERALARNLFFALRWTISRIPYPVYRFFEVFFTLLGLIFMQKKRKLAKENLRTAFGDEKTREEIDAIARDCFNNFGKGMIDLIYFLDRPKEILEKVSIEGKEHLDKVLADGKGAVIVSAHFGSFILMYLRIILEGYKINIIMRRVRDTEFENYISNFRKEKGMNTIYALPARQCVQKSIKVLRDNQILFILLDQNFGGEGRIFVDFFGHKAATAAGPVIFAGRTGSPILPMFIRKDKTEKKKFGDIQRHKIIIEPPIELEDIPEKQQYVEKNIAHITKIIERYVRRYPEEWGGWMHKRWKSRKVEEQKILDEQKEKQT